jgi:aminopeptidase-like protein
VTCYVILYGSVVAAGAPSVLAEDEKRWSSYIRETFNWWHFTPSAYLIHTSMATESISSQLHAAVPTMPFALIELAQRGQRRINLGAEGFSALEWLDERLGRGPWQ